MGLNVISIGFEKALASIRSVFGIVNTDAKQFMRTKSTEFVGLAQEYPPETEANRPPPPFYTRTNTLKDGWSTRDSGNGYLIENPVPYLPWVHGTQKQAWFHKARGWKTIKNFLDLIGLNGEEQGDHILLETPAITSLRTRVTEKIKRLFI